MHVGTVRSALFNYFFAKKYGGDFIVRIEDTDKERNRTEHIDAIWRDFEWLGIPIDERYVQSEHVSRHTEALSDMIARDVAYVSREPSKSDPSKDVEVVRLRNPGKVITFKDEIRDEVTFDTTELGDFVIARSISDPLYHLAVVVDDHDEGITHVIRAEEHLSNTPRQILIQEALGFARPTYAHMPLILAPDRTKLSKRRHAVSIGDFRDRGFLPASLINFLALLGWNPGTDEEFFTLEELVERFDLSQVQKAGAVFNEEKLRWFNKHYLAQISDADFLSQARSCFAAYGSTPDDAVFARMLPSLRERIEVWEDLSKDLERGEWDFVTTAPSYSTVPLVWKKSDAATTKKHLDALHTLITGIPITAFDTPAAIKEHVWPYADANDRGAVLWPLRVALSGREKSPDPFTLLYILGREASLRRILNARDTV